MTMLLASAGSAAVNRFVERMRTLDPNYGSQQHQRDFIERYEERQRRNPCTHDHEHVDACYPPDAMDAVVRSQIEARRPPPTPHAWRTEALAAQTPASPSAETNDATGAHWVPWW